MQVRPSFLECDLLITCYICEVLHAFPGIWCNIIILLSSVKGSTKYMRFETGKTRTVMCNFGIKFKLIHQINEVLRNKLMYEIIHLWVICAWKSWTVRCLEWIGGFRFLNVCHEKVQLKWKLSYFLMQVGGIGFLQLMKSFSTHYLDCSPQNC